MEGASRLVRPPDPKSERSRFSADRPFRKIAAQLIALGVSRGVLLFSTIVVARLAGIGEFGDFALALVVFQAGLLLRDAGLGQAVIILGGHDAALTRHAFVWVTTIGIALAAIMAIGAEAILSLLGLPKGADSLRWLALAFGVGSLGVVPNASLERNLRFEARAIIDILAYGALAGVAIGGALAGLGIEALAFGYIAQGAIQAAGGLILAPPWSATSADRATLGALARYGGLLWASALLSYVATNVDNASVGRLGGAAALGLYALSYTVGNTITISVGQALNRVALPYYARAVRDERARSGVLQSVLPLTIAVAVLPAALIIGLAPELRNLLFSAGATMLPLVILTWYGVVRTLGVTLGTALNGVGLARIQLRSSAINVGLLLVGIVPGFEVAGATGVAIVVLLAVTASAAYLLGVVVDIFAVRARFLVYPALSLGAITLATAWPMGPAPAWVRWTVALFVAAGAVVWALRMIRSWSDAAQG